MVGAVESALARKRRARRMHRVLAVTYPDAQCELNYTNPLELTVATILSAQCTDVRVNEVTAQLFPRFDSAQAYAGANPEELQEIVRPAGFFRNKTNSIIRLGQALVERHGGEVPETMDDLIALPGIGRKTANVIIGNAFSGQAIAVDTHVIRLTGRWKWTESAQPDVIERDLQELFDRRDWTILSHRIIFHGRRVCHARNPKCHICPLTQDCPSVRVVGP